MEDCAELHDWELVAGCDFTDNIMSVMVLKDDYFSIDFSGSPCSGEVSDEGGVDSDNPSYDESDCDSNNFLEASRDNVGVVRMKFPKRNSDGFWSDESTVGRRLLAASETPELGNMEDSVSGMGTLYKEIDPVVKDLGGGSEAGESSCEPVWDNSGEGTEWRESSSRPVCENFGGRSEGSESSDSSESAEVEVEACVTEGEKSVKLWLKMPMVLLKYCFFGMKPVWSLSMAAAMVAILMLLKKLYRMKHKIRSIPLRIAMGDKKISQLDARATSLNKAISAVRLTPTMRPSIHAGVATQFAALPTSGAI